MKYLEGEGKKEGARQRRKKKKKKEKLTAANSSPFPRRHPDPSCRPVKPKRTDRSSSNQFPSVRVDEYTMDTFRRYTIPLFPQTRKSLTTCHLSHTHPRRLDVYRKVPTDLTHASTSGAIGKKNIFSHLWKCNCQKRALSVCIWIVRFGRHP